MTTDKVLTEEQFKSGITFDDFLAETERKVAATDVTSLDQEALETFKYTDLNVHRMKRGIKSFTPDEQLVELVNKSSAGTKWLVITEDWCGDSAQCLPGLYLMAKANPSIEFRIFERDKNPELMDKYLTNGTRSVPILVGMNEQFEEIFHWGSRPKEAADLVKEWKAQGLEKAEFIERLHVWYGRNRCKALQEEIKTILAGV